MAVLLNIHMYMYYMLNTCTITKLWMRLSLAIRLHSNFSHTHTHLATSDFQTNTTYVEMIATHRYSPPKTDGRCIMLSYSLSMLSHCRHPQVIYTCTKDEAIMLIFLPIMLFCTAQNFLQLCLRYM